MKINSVSLMDVFDFLDNEVENNSIDLAIIDPPYNVLNEKWDIFKNKEEYFDFTFKWLEKVLLKLKETGTLYLFNNSFNSAIILNYLIKRGIKFQNWIIWHKKDGFNGTKKRYVNNQETILFVTKTENYFFDPEIIRVAYDSKERLKSAKTKGILKNGKRWFPNVNGKLCTDVWNFSSVRHTQKIKGKITKTVHPTPKPEGMIERIILASSKEDDLILDLFSGSGTTSYVAKKLKRNYVGCENDENYMEIIKKRLEN